MPVIFRRPQKADHSKQSQTQTPPKPVVEEPALHSPQDRLEEACGLARAIDLEIIEAKVVPIPLPKPGTLFGSGKVVEIRDLVKDTGAELVIVDHALTPIQQRNLEVDWNTKVLDRTGLILEIFGARARTREGRLQVELAHLTYQKGRLVRAWSHLERQRGGAAFVGGPGEAQIELDRRMLDQRIVAIKRELAQVVKTRELHRAGRRKVPYPIVALVGYTNAGKSTLFNTITGEDVTAQDQVFATLDPTMREVRLDSGRRIILSDTVGFISDLPTSLVAAFRATLEEVVEADLIVHVRDISHPETDAQRLDVEHVLRGLNINLDEPDHAIMEVWNKIDLLPDDYEDNARFKRLRDDVDPSLISALNGGGINELLCRIDTVFGREDIDVTLAVAPEDGKLRHWLYEHVNIVNQSTDDGGTTNFDIRLSPEQHGRLKHILSDTNNDTSNDDT